MTRHRDESGQPCTRHGEVTEQRLYELATLGSRVPAFHHDAASKLQSLIMALDEIGDLGTDPELRTPIDTAQAALRELHQILNANRALAKAPQRTRVPLAELVQRASETVGVRTRGDLAGHEARVAVPAMRHALSQLLDLTAGTGHVGRIVEVACTRDRDQLELTLVGTPEAVSKAPADASEVTAIAAFVIGREDGELRCSPRGFVVRVPAAPPASGTP